MPMFPATALLQCCTCWLDLLTAVPNKGVVPSRPFGTAGSKFCHEKIPDFVVLSLKVCGVTVVDELFFCFFCFKTAFNNLFLFSALLNLDDFVEMSFLVVQFHCQSSFSQRAFFDGL